MLAILIAYYRWMTLVIVLALAVWGLLVFGVASLISGWTNYALSLAGVTGIIVSIGVTVDSYVVFFERIKDETAQRTDAEERRATELGRHLANHLGRQRRLDHRCGHPVRAERRLRPRIRLVPRCHDVV